ncbi:hypothetical protein Zmor_018005 [Zophobas morio]|uniref:acid phosphatase n=1 Tax=Zophobas morio TaxID=2755281 RepID=A0AA38IDD2_9CUCU|nr:hypothetical protein Zmor_018005 [Zophobas morio]
MFLLIIFSVVTVTSSNQLLSAVVIHRHGDRNPYTTFKTDLYSDESHWPEGFGQLTKRGIQRQYELGLWLNNRYASFLPSHYSPRHIRAVSTDVDRTLMSAEVTLAGLYPPLDNDKFNENINWQPIPIHTAPRTEDPLLAMKKPCKKYKRIFSDLLKSPHITEINSINKNLYEFLSNKTGNDINDVYDVEDIYNALHSQFLANKTLPDWTAEVYPDKMKAAVLLKFKLPCYTAELARLKTGLLMGEIVRNFRGFVEGTNMRKLLTFSGHDSTLAEVLTTLGAFNDEVPPYSSAILLELYENEGEFHVNVFFKNSTGLHELFVETCDFDCKFEDFERILRVMIIDSVEQWEEECEN